MAKKHPSGQNPSNSAADSTLNSKPYRTGEKGDRADHLIVPGEGVYFSQHAMQGMQRKADENYRGMPENARDSNDRKVYAVGCLSEEEVLGMAEKIRKHREMKKTEAEYREGKRKRGDNYEEMCHEGTDAIDPEKNPHKLPGQRSNDFAIDMSQSRISILGTTSTGTWLNGSAVKHNSFITITLTTPDGRRYAEAMLTYDQFAAALVSNSEQPCTMHTYWGMTDHTELLTEVVKLPDSIVGRLEQRLEDRIEELAKGVEESIAEAKDRVADGKGLPKSSVEKLIGKVERMAEWYRSNTAFTVSQAVKETTSIVEQAAIAAAHAHQISAEGVQSHGGMQMLLGSIMEGRQRQIEASKD